MRVIKPTTKATRTRRAKLVYTGKKNVASAMVIDSRCRIVSKVEVR